MNRIILPGVLILLLANPVVAGTLTVIRSGASVNLWLNAHDAHSLSDTIYEHGIVLGDGFWEGEPLYRIYIPSHPSGDSYITSISITIDGDNAWFSWPEVYVGNEGPYDLGDEPLHLLFYPYQYPYIMWSAGDGLAYVMDIRLDVGWFTERYDLDKITVACEYSGVPTQTLENFQQVYGAYRALDKYKSDMVNALWNTGPWLREAFYLACQRTISLADSISGLSGSLFSAVKGTLGAIEEFQSLGGDLGSAHDYVLFWLSCYYGPDKGEVSDDLVAASNELYDLAQAWKSKAFDGRISNEESVELAGAIGSAKTLVGELSSTLQNVRYYCHQVLSDSCAADDTAEIMLRSLSPLLITTPPYSGHDPNSYILKLIEALQSQIDGLPSVGALTVTINPAEVRADARWRLTSGPDTGWKSSGAVINYITPGSYTLQCQDVAGWEEPSDRVVTVAQGTNAETATYIRLGFLQVTINPSEVRGSARWRLTTGPDTSWQESADTIGDILTGSYEIEFNEVLGWRRPEDRTITISGDSNSETGTYIETVYFADPNLQAAVEQALGIPSPIPSEMLALTSLRAGGLVGIADLTGLEYATNLGQLNLANNQITNLSGLSDAGLTSLTELNLSSNQITDLSSLSGAGLTNLTWLDLSSNQITDLSGLSDAGLTSLTGVCLWNNQITDLSPLAGLTSLTWLHLGDNQITELSPLSGLTSLANLYLWGNQITELSPLSGLTSLTRVNLSSNQITDLSGLSGAGLTSLTEVWLDHNRITDLSGLSGAGLTSLTELSLSDNQITDLSPLSGLTNLAKLWLYRNPLNTAAYCIYLPLILANNPGIDLLYDAPVDCNGNGVSDECDTIGGGDFDADGDVDLDDFVVLVDCLAGPGQPPNVSEPACATAILAAFDLNADGDVDLADYAVFAANFTGPL